MDQRFRLYSILIFGVFCRDAPIVIVASLRFFMFKFLKKVETRLIASLLFFLFITIIFFYRFLDGLEIFAYQDFSRYFYPLRHFMVHELFSGSIPLWNDKIFCGTPFIGGLQHGLFYPLTLVFYILPFNIAFNLFTVIHYFLAAIFAYLFFYHKTKSSFGGIVAGLSFSFSGYLLSVSSMNTTLTSIVWFPLGLYFLDKLSLDGQKVWSAISLALVISLMFLGGEPTILFLFVITGAFYLFYFSMDKRKSFLFFTLSFILFILITAVQLFPFVEFILHSDRVFMRDYHLVASESFPMKESINFILPYFWGNPNIPGSYNQAFLGNEFQKWIISPYIGFFAIIFALF